MAKQLNNTILLRSDELCAVVVAAQHKKLSVEGGGTAKDLRKGQKQGDLQIWDPVDKVRVQRFLCCGALSSFFL